MNINSVKHDTLQRLTELEIEYWHDVDFNWGRAACTAYVDDGVFAIGDRRLQGCDAIAEFYRWRQGRGDRTTRHVVTNFRLEKLAGTCAVLQCILFLYAADGNPVLKSKPPIIIADVLSECIFCGDDQWRFQSHTLSPIFMGDELPTIPEPTTVPEPK